MADSQQEFANILAATGARYVAYCGVHANMCLMNREFSIPKVRSWGFPKERVAIIRDLTDVMFNPLDVPYVTVKEALALQVGYLEKFFCSSFSSQELL